MKLIDLFLVILFLTGSTLCLSQKLDNYNFKKITVNDHLSHSDVNVIAQDLDGYLWIATNNGLNRYDGYEIETFKSDVDDTTSIPGNRVKEMVIDKEGIIWIYLENLGLYCFNPRNMGFRNISLLEKGKTSFLQSTIVNIVSHEGALFVSDMDSKVYKLSAGINRDNYEVEPIYIDRTSESNFEAFTVTTEGVLCLYSNGDIYQVNDALNKASKLAYDWSELGRAQRLDFQDGFLYSISSSHISTFKFNDTTWSFLRSGEVDISKDTNVRNFTVDMNSDFWFSDATSVYKAERLDEIGEFSNAFVLEELPIGRTSQLFQDKFGVLWIPTLNSGIQYVSLDRKPFYHLQNKREPNRMISAILKDEEGRIWIGAREGLNLFEKVDHLKNYKLRDEFFDGEYISFITKDHSGEIWIGLKSGGLFKIRETNSGFDFISVGDFIEGDLTEMDNLMRMTVDADGRLWISTFTNGVFVLDLEMRTFSNLLHNPKTDNTLASNNLTDIYYDNIENCVWVGSRDAGLCKISNLRADVFDYDNFSYDPKDSKSISSNHTWQMLRDSDSSLWIATLGGGLNNLLEEKKSSKISFKRYTTRNGLVDNDVEGLLEDEEGNLWLSGRGLSKFNVSEESFVHFDFEDGLQSNSFKVGAAFKDDKEQLYFGGINGVNYFDPSDIILDTIAPSVFISELRVNDGENVQVLKPSSVDHDLSFASDDNNLSFSFIGLQFDTPQKNQYKYRLLGHDDDWISEKYPNLTANYLNVPPGTYTFQVRASNKDGVWSSHTAELKVEIHKPWYATYLAFLFYVILLGLALYFYRKITENQLRLKNNLLIAEKEHELDRSKFSFFTKISHELRTPLTLIKGPLEELLLLPKLSQLAKNKLHLVERSTSRLLNLTNQLLDFRKMETGNMKLQASENDIIKFSHEIFLLFSQSASDKDINYKFEAALNSASIYFDKEKLEIILMNLLMNAYKYSDAKGEIVLRVISVGDLKEKAEWSHDALNKNYLRLEVEDSGKGMSISEVKKIFNPYYQVKNVSSSQQLGTGLGLSLVKGMVKLHKGDIIIESEEGRGTKCVVHLPFGNSHLEDIELVDKTSQSSRINKYNELEEEVTSLKEKDAYLSDLKMLEKKYKVLVVEDNIDINKYIQEVLRDEFLVEVAYNGMEGFEMALEFEPDLILSDVMMPVLDGIGLCEKIKKSDKTAHIPIILLTARTTAVYQLHGLNQGAEDYISKPFSASILKMKIHTILKNRELQREFYRRQMHLMPIQETNMNSDEQVVYDAIKFIEENVNNVNLDVVLLSEAMHQSRSNLYRKVKLVTGKSLVELIRDVRLKYAASLLKENKMTVTEIAYMSGFSSIKYFRKCFKKQYETNPSEFHKVDISSRGRSVEDQIKYN